MAITSETELPLDSFRNEWDGIIRSIAESLGVDTSGAADTSEITRLLENATCAKLTERARNSSLVVLSSIAGGGKSTVGGILESLEFTRLPRVTTRVARPGEEDGHAYFFVTKEEFDRELAAGELAYAKETYSEGRGIRRSSLDAVRNGGARYYAEGDALAYDTIKKTVHGYEDLDYCSLFLVPDSFDTAYVRLQGRIRNDIANGADPTGAYKDVNDRIRASLVYLQESGSHMRNGIYHGYLVNDDLSRVRARLESLFLV